WKRARGAPRSARSPTGCAPSSASIGRRLQPKGASRWAGLGRPGIWRGRGRRSVTQARGPAPRLLEVSDLSTHFPADGAVVRAVDRVSFHVDGGERHRLVCEAGTGNSADG